MKGIELIAQERSEQIEKHNRTIDNDVLLNNERQLSIAASALLYESEIKDAIPALQSRYFFQPYGWDTKIWQKMCEKSYKDRLVIAGALIAAEIDRITKQG